MTQVAKTEASMAPVGAGEQAVDAQVTAAVITGICAFVAAAIPIIIYKRRDHQSIDVAQNRSTQNANLTLDGILDRLHRHRQRATYRAVGGLLGRQPHTLFDGYPFTPRNSWVVRKGDGRPTNYPPAQVHPDLLLNGRVIMTMGELKAWLAEHH